MGNISLSINGASYQVDADPGMPLLWVLRDLLGLTGTKFSCGIGVCGSCTVIIDGEAVRSCVTPVSSVKSEITTLDGLAKDGRLHPLQQAWIDKQAMQCGYCSNGQIMTAKALLDRNPHPSNAEIREAMKDVLCRCFTHYRIQDAIRHAATLMAEGKRGTGKEAHK